MFETAFVTSLWQSSGGLSCQFVGSLALNYFCVVGDEHIIFIKFCSSSEKEYSDPLENVIK